jgi:hypothetical protein
MSLSKVCKGGPNHNLPCVGDVSVGDTCGVGGLCQPDWCATPKWCMCMMM